MPQETIRRQFFYIRRGPDLGYASLALDEIGQLSLFARLVDLTPLEEDDVNHGHNTNRCHLGPKLILKSR